MRVYLLVDCTYLAWRAFYTTGSLSYGGIPTGVAFGVLRDLERLTALYNPDASVLAFDYGGPGLRHQIYPEYKSSRKRENLTGEEKEARTDLYRQMRRLRADILPRMGFKNIVCEKGYEADDVLAWYAERIRDRDRGVVVTADNDLYQCINHNVFWFNPNGDRIVTDGSFKEEWGIEPVMWSHVKAIAGCPSDGVPGVEGIGEKTAAKWLSKGLNEGKKKRAIEENLDLVNRNLKLVRLPYPGLDLPDIIPDELTEEKRIEIQSELGIRSDRKRKSRKSEDKGAVGFDV